jgi:polysaccharide biosynthesis transport protein
VNQARLNRPTEPSYVVSYPEAPEEARSALSVAQGLIIFKAYWRLSALIVTVLLALVVLYVWSLPRAYTATVTMMGVGQNNDPLAADQGPAADVLGNYMATQAELITSPGVLARVIDRMQLTADPEFSAGFKGSGTALNEYAQKQLLSALQVNVGRGGTLLYIIATTRDGAKSARLANTVANTYLQQDATRNSGPANERAVHYSEHLTELRAKVVAAQDAVSKFRQDNHLTDVGGGANADVETQALAAQEQRLLEAQNALRTAEAKAVETSGFSDAAQTSPLIVDLKGRLSTLQVQLAQLEGTYGPEHPRIIEVKSQIEAVKKSIAGENTALSQNGSAEIAGARALVERYQHAVDEQRSKTLAERALQDEGTKLSVELDSAQTVYKRALDGYDQIMFAATGNHTNISVINPALPPAQASKSKKMKFLAAGFILSLGLGLAMPFAYEILLNRRLRCRDDFENSFGIPVLAEFNSLPRLQQW